MSGKKNIRAAVGEFCGIAFGASSTTVIVKTFGQIKRVMRDDDFQHFIVKIADFSRIAVICCRVDASVFDRQRTRRVDADDGDFFVFVKGFASRSVIYFLYFSSGEKNGRKHCTSAHRDCPERRFAAAAIYLKTLSLR